MGSTHSDILETKSKSTKSWDVTQVKDMHEVLRAIQGQLIQERKNRIAKSLECPELGTGIELVRATQELNAFAGFIPAIPSTAGSEASTTVPKTDTAHHAGGQHTEAQGGPERSSSCTNPAHSSDDLKNIVRAMGRHLIRQEDSISILQQDTQLIVFLKNREQGKPASEDWSIVQALFLVGKHWREQKEKSPSQVTQPLRVVLLGSMLDAMLNRVKQLETDPQLREVAEKRGLVVNGAFPYLQ